LTVVEYDSDQNHREFKGLLDTLKKKGISREIVAKKLKINKSTLTRIYNAGNPNPQNCLHYNELIKKEFGKELGLETEAPPVPYDTMIKRLNRKMNFLQKEIQALRESNARIEKALNIPGIDRIKKS